MFYLKLYLAYPKLHSPDAFQAKYPIEVSDVHNELSQAVPNFKFALDDRQRDMARDDRLRQVFGSYYGQFRDGNQSFQDYTDNINGK